MGPVQAVKSGFKRYVDFKGRSSRSEYWWWQLLVAIVFLPAIVAAEGNLADSPLIIASTIGIFLMLIPTIAITMRRLHDQDMSAWWYLLNFVPYIGGLVLVVICIRKGTVGANRFGEDPLQPTGENLQEVFS